MMNMKAKTIGVLSFLFVTSAWAERPWPETTYDCQVKTVSGAQGIVTIQASSLAQAEQDVVGQSARTILGNQEASVSVKQCVVYGKEEFTDPSFRHWRRGLEG